ncbi:17607_t:CDS:2, partial [Acaulospora morrowiae]
MSYEADIKEPPAKKRPFLTIEKAVFITLCLENFYPFYIHTHIPLLIIIRNPRNHERLG